MGGCFGLDGQIVRFSESFYAGGGGGGGGVGGGGGGELTTTTAAQSLGLNLSSLGWGKLVVRPSEFHPAATRYITEGVLRLSACECVCVSPLSLPYSLPSPPPSVSVPVCLYDILVPVRT